MDHAVEKRIGIFRQASRRRLSKRSSALLELRVAFGVGYFRDLVRATRERQCEDPTKLLPVWWRLPIYF